MAAREIEQALLVGLGGDPAQRVRGRNVDQQARAVGHRRFQRVEIDRVPVAAQRVWNLSRHGVRQSDDRGAVGPGRRQQQRLIPRIERRPDRHVQRLHAGSRDHDFAGRVDLHLVQLAVRLGDRAAQRRQSRVFGVKRVALAHGAFGRVFDVIRRRQVRFAEIEAQHALHTHRDLRQFAYAGVRHSFDGRSDARHLRYCRTGHWFDYHGGLTTMRLPCVYATWAS